MSTYKVCLPEIIRVWAQWLGFGLAAIPTGILLGLLLKYGMNEAVALVFVLPLGFILGIVAWVLIGRWVVAKPVEYTIGVCTDVVSLPDYAGAVAVAVLCVTLYSFQPLSGTGNYPPAPSSINALSQL